MPEIIIYSVIIGDYDKLIDPKIFDKNIKYILFTDNNNLTSNVWDVKYIDVVDTPQKTARYYKLNPHIVLPEHKINIWVDGSLTPKFSDAEKLLNDINFDGKTIMCYRHYERNCTYDESDMVVRLKLDDPTKVAYQMEGYYNEGLPMDFGLFETGFMIRENNEKINRFNELWWQEVLNKSHRDQLSIMYVSWKTKIKVSPILVGFSVRTNNFLETIRLHNHEDKKPKIAEKEILFQSNGKIVNRILI